MARTCVLVQNATAGVQQMGHTCHRHPRRTVHLGRGEGARNPMLLGRLGTSAAGSNTKRLGHSGILAGTLPEGGLFPYSPLPRLQSSLSSRAANGTGNDRPLRGGLKAKAGGREGQGEAGEGPENDGAPRGNSSGSLPTASKEASPSPTVDVNGPFLRFAAQCVVAVLALGFVDAGYSGDWSRIGAITPELEAQLRGLAFVVVPLAGGAVWYIGTTGKQ